MRLLSTVLLTLIPSMTFAGIEAKITQTESHGNKTMVGFSLKNTFKQPVKGVRAWVFLSDADGKVVANKAQWIVGTESKHTDALAADGEETFNMVIDTPKPIAKASVTFSRIVLADGTTADPQKDVSYPEK